VAPIEWHSDDIFPSSFADEVVSLSQSDESVQVKQHVHRRYTGPSSNQPNQPISGGKLIISFPWWWAPPPKQNMNKQNKKNTVPLRTAQGLQRLKKRLLVSTFLGVSKPN